MLGFYKTGSRTRLSAGTDMTKAAKIINSSSDVESQQPTKRRTVVHNNLHFLGNIGKARSEAKIIAAQRN
jgi:hypothetical protein